LENLLLKLFNSWVSGLNDIFAAWLNMMSDNVYHCENAFSSLGGVQTFDISKVFAIIFQFSLYFASFKIVKKLYEIYFLHMAGDPSQNPIAVVKGAALAVIAAVGFNWFYEVMVTIAQQLMDAVLNAIGEASYADNLIQALTSIMGNLNTAIFVLIFVILSLILYVKFIGLGVELMILRIGFPIACLGLMDSDKGVFAPYCKKIMIIFITVFVQTVVYRLAVSIMAADHPIWGIAFCMAAMKAPNSLRDFMFTYSGGGLNAAMSVASHAQSLYRSFASKAVSVAAK
jgi:hypothetical protein